MHSLPSTYTNCIPNQNWNILYIQNLNKLDGELSKILQYQAEQPGLQQASQWRYNLYRKQGACTYSLSSFKDRII